MRCRVWPAQFWSRWTAMAIRLYLVTTIAYNDFAATRGALGPSWARHLGRIPWISI